MQIALQSKPPDWVSHWHRPAEELAEAVRTALFGLPCQFECLVFVATLQKPDVRAHFCESLGIACDRESVDLVVCRKHH